MEVKVSLNNLRTAPRKVRLVVDLIRGKNISDARNALEFAVKKSSEPVLKLLNSAVASALHDFKLKESDLYISKITVDEGPKLKRSHPMSRGRAYPILKRTSHINLILSEVNLSKPKEDKQEIKKEVKEVKKNPPTSRLRRTRNNTKRK